MGNGVSLKRSIVASLCGHPDALKYQQQAVAGSAGDIVSDLAQRVVLTKADFMGLDDAGKPFLDNPGAWENFDKIAKIIQLGGERLTFDDFTRPLTSTATGTGKNILECARTGGALAKIFSFDIWKGHYDEMEKLWYRMSKPDRSRTFPSANSSATYAMLPRALKKSLLTYEGRVAPEERLERAGLTLDEIRRSAVDIQTYNNVNRKLRLAGDYFRKDYVMMPDSEGDTMFDGREQAWSKFPAVVAIMAEHGERLEVQDYLRQYSTSRSLLARAADARALDKVFAAEQWVDRLPDMLSLWSNVLDAWKTAPMTPRDFDNAYAKAEGLTYSKVFMERTFEGKSDLMTPLNTGKDECPVIPLGLKVLWESIDTVQAHLRDVGEPITLEDLRAPSGQMGDSCLMIAAKYGFFDKVIDIVRSNGDQLTLEDYRMKDGHGDTLISILSEKRQLNLVFTPDAWVGHVSELRSLWSMVSGSQRRQVDYQEVEVKAQQATLKQRKPHQGNRHIRPN